MKREELVWNVYEHEFNQDKIVKYNIFNHGGFWRDVIAANKEYADDEDFYKAVMESARYYFWAKCECEVLIGGIFSKCEPYKFDWYDQITMNEHIFKDYIISHRKDIPKRMPR